MARVNIPLTNQVAARGVVNTAPTISIGNIQNAVGRQAASLTSTALGMAQDYKRQYDRAKLVAQENSFVNVLSQTLPSVIEEIGDITTQTVNTITAIDEQQYGKELKLIEDMFVLDKTGEIEDSYRKMYAENGANAESMMSWLNETINSHLGEAPSQVAQARYLDKAYKMKYVALQQSLDAEEATRKQVRADGLTRQVERSSAALVDSPDDLPLQLNKIKDYSKILQNEGAAPEEVDSAIQLMAQSMVDSALKGLNNNGRSEEALEQLATPEIQQQLNPELRAKHVESATLEILRREELRKTEAKTALDLDNFAKGFLQDGMPGSNKASFLHFNSFMTEHLDGGNNVNADTYQAGASDLAAYFRAYNKYVGTDTKDYISGRLKSSDNPYEVAMYASAIDSMVNDERFKGLNIASSFAKGNKAEVAEALTISRLIRAGENPEAVIQNVRANLRESNPAKIEARKQQLTTYLKENKPADIMDDAYGGYFWQKDPVNLAHLEQEYESTFKDYFTMTGDPEVSAKAAKAFISDRYRPSKINRKNEIMLGAPELYFGDRMEQFEGQYSAALQAITKSMGGEMKDDRTAIVNGREVAYDLRAIHGYTPNQKGKKTYLVFDSVKGGPLMNKNGEYVTFSFGIDAQEYEDNLNRLNQQALEERDATLAEDEAATKRRIMQSEAFKKSLQGLQENRINGIIRKIQAE